MSDDLEISMEAIDDGVVMRPIGEIDLNRAPTLRLALSTVLQEHPQRLVVDLREVPYIDSPGVATLIEGLRLARGCSCMLVICGLQSFVRSVFEISRVHDSVFTVVDDLEQALQLPNRRGGRRVKPRFLRCDLGEIVDLSISGVRVRTRRRPPKQVAVRLRQSGVDLRLTADVMWSKRAGLFAHEAGLRFVGLDGDMRATLQRIVDETIEEACTEAGSALAGR